MEGIRFHAITDRYGGVTLIDTRTSRSLYLNPIDDSSQFLSSWDLLIHLWSSPIMSLQSIYPSPEAHFDSLVSPYFPEEP